MAQHLPLMTLCLLAGGECCFGIEVAANAIKGDVLGTGEAEVTATLEGGMGLSSVVNPLFVGSTANRIGGLALVPRGGGWSS